MTPRPTVGDVAEDLYEAVAPLAWNDANVGWHLLLYCEAAGRMLEQVHDYVREHDDLGLPGWGILFSVDDCPEEALGYLAQFVGVTLLAGATAAQSRSRIRNTDGFKAGTPGAIVEAAEATLTGTQTVRLLERYLASDPSADHAYHLQVRTRASETPDPDATLAAVLTQKPAGIVLDYAAVAGADYQQHTTQNATYTARSARFATYAAATADTLEE